MHVNVVIVPTVVFFCFCSSFSPFVLFLVKSQRLLSSLVNTFIFVYTVYPYVYVFGNLWQILPLILSHVVHQSSSSSIFVFPGFWPVCILLVTDYKWAIFQSICAPIPAMDCDDRDFCICPNKHLTHHTTCVLFLISCKNLMCHIVGHYIKKRHVMDTNSPNWLHVNLQYHFKTRRKSNSFFPSTIFPKTHHQSSNCLPVLSSVSSSSLKNILLIFRINTQ